MNLGEIKAEARGVARDEAADDKNRLWKDADLTLYANRVYRKIARETKCIRDAITPEVCLLPVTVVDHLALEEGSIDYLLANDSNSWLYQLDVAPLTLPLHSSILDIEEMKWVTKGWKLHHVSVSKWQTNYFWDRVPGLATEFCTDYSNGRLALNYRATENDILKLVVKRMPLVNLADDADVPEFRPDYHDAFLPGLLSHMYSKQDAECIDLKKAADYLAEFERAIDLIKRQESRLHGSHPVANHSLGAFR